MDNYRNKSNGMINEVLIIGAGLGGMDCALDLANAGYLVHLVEKNPSIGGRYAQVYKIFPYDECSACILTPKMSEVLRHPNIKLLTLAEVKEVKGTTGNFTVRIIKHPRYVDEEKCTGCQKCIERCPIEVPSEYNFGLGLRKAIYLDFPQQIPLVATIDKTHCIGCGICEATCPTRAINYNMRAEEIELIVGSIVVATGFDEFDPSIKEEYGYGIFSNVITSLQLERLSHPSGPTGGEILRPSDGKEPQKIVLINCCGARDAQIGVNYCNKVCCMFSMKSARNMRIHFPEAEIYLCYMDIRAAGKLFETYYRSTLEDYGIKFIRGRPSQVTEDSTHNLKIKLENTETGEQTELTDVELVVLNCSFIPPSGIDRLVRVLNLNLEDDGFIGEKHPNYANIQTSVPGVYVLGVAHGPRDGTDTVVEAKAVASACTTNLPLPRRMKEKPPLSLELKGEPRVGVFVCHCGGVISRVVNVKKVVEEAKKLPGVIQAEDYLFMCSDPGQRLIRDSIKKHNLNRVIVCSCTPRVHEKTFREAVKSEGLPEYYFEGPINIREQDAMVHHEQPEKATKKAVDLMRGGVGRVINLDTIPTKILKVNPRALVIGGGIAGMSAALDIADKGFKVFLVEKEEELGGRLRELYRVFPVSEDARKILEATESRVREHPNISILTSSEVMELEGTIGNFDVKVKDSKDNVTSLNVGAIIVAVGTKEYKPKVGEYGYGRVEGVTTSLEFEQFLRNRSINEPRRIVFIQCVGSRNSQPDSNFYCSRVCCNVTLINCKSIKEIFPNVRIYVLFMEDFRAYGRHMEELYKEASERLGVTFIRWIREKPPVVNLDAKTRKPLVSVYDSLRQLNLQIPADYVILSVGQEPPLGLSELCERLGITTSRDGFIEEAHLKFKPVDTKKPGIFTASSYPKDIADSINLGRAAASAAMVHLIPGEIELEMIKSIVDGEICVGCGLCESMCPFLAITMEIKNGKEVSVTDEIKCQGCGVCVAGCPVGARELRWWRDEAFIAQIDAITTGD